MIWRRGRGNGRPLYPRLYSFPCLKDLLKMESFWERARRNPWNAAITVSCARATRAWLRLIIDWEFSPLQWYQCSDQEKSQFGPSSLPDASTIIYYFLSSPFFLMDVRPTLRSQYCLCSRSIIWNPDIFIFPFSNIATSYGRNSWFDTCESQSELISYEIDDDIMIVSLIELSCSNSRKKLLKTRSWSRIDQNSEDTCDLICDIDMILIDTDWFYLLSLDWICEENHRISPLPMAIESPVRIEWWRTKDQRPPTCPTIVSLLRSRTFDQR